MNCNKIKNRIDRCERCGTCCKKGGPALHTEDKSLIVNGCIPLKNLFTIREGEPAFDNIKNRLSPAESDIIKIAAKPLSSECIFYNSALKGCDIYKTRPLECRVLFCKNTKEIIDIYNKNRLTRKDILENTKTLWELVNDHQQKCSYEKLNNLSFIYKNRNSDEIKKEINEIVAYDHHLRDVLIEKSSTYSDLINFLFGKPLKTHNYF